MSSVNISLYLNSRPDRFLLHNVNFNGNVEAVKKEIAQKYNLEIKSLNCVHRGVLLQDSNLLQLSGIQSGSVIQCILKHDIKTPSVTALNLVEVQQLLVSLRSAISNLAFRSFIKKLRTSQLEHLLTECPALVSEPAAIAFLQDPEFIIALQNVEILTRVVEERPIIGRALQIVCNLLSKEVTSPRRSHHVSYSMDALSDDEMDTEQQQNESETSSQRSDFQAITPAQLAAALANATGGNSWRGASSSTPLSGLTPPPSSALTPLNTPAPPSGGSGAATGGTSPGGPITTEMFSQALQNALAASASRTSDSLSSTPAPVPAASSVQLPNVEESLQLMREMGISDEGMSLQALQATDGDVQAAVNLIFAQWMADD